jgi:hypothetical protein
LFLLPALFIAGLMTFLKTDHHLRQFAWVFVFGAVPAIAGSRWGRIVATAGWMPVALVVGLTVSRPADPTRTMMELPGGWRLSASHEERTRIEGIHDALSALERLHGRGPVMFDPNGAGFYVVYGFPHVSRQTWFYEAAVRPYEFDELQQRYRALSALVVCGTADAPVDPRTSILTATFPEELGAAIRARAAEVVWSDRACRSSGSCLHHQVVPRGVSEHRRAGRSRPASTS